MNTAKSQSAGFTLIEIVITITILSIIATATAFSFTKFNSNQALDKSRSLVSSVLNQARMLTLSSKDNSQYGVRLDSSAVVLFTGDSYSPTEESNVSFPLSGLVSLSVSLSGGGSEVVFERLSGKTEQSGTITLALVSDPTASTTITVFETGIIQSN